MPSIRDAGATVINIPDTVGYSYHDEYAHIFKTLTESVTSSNEIIYSAHCHDDLGMAVSNSLAAIEGGASTAVCTHFTKNGNSVRVASSGEN